MREDLTVNGLRRGAIARDILEGNFSDAISQAGRATKNSPSYDTSSESQRTIGRMRHICRTIIGSCVRKGPENE